MENLSPLLCLAALFAFSMIAVAVMGLAEWLVGRAAYACGGYRFGVRIMAMSGLFLRRLPEYCARASAPCDGSCKCWTCPLYHGFAIDADN